MGGQGALKISLKDSKVIIYGIQIVQKLGDFADIVLRMASTTLLCVLFAYH